MPFLERDADWWLAEQTTLMLHETGFSMGLPSLGGEGIFVSQVEIIEGWKLSGYRRPQLVEKFE